jgi:hypothetical protein
MMGRRGDVVFWAALASLIESRSVLVAAHIPLQKESKAFELYRSEYAVKKAR